MKTPKYFICPMSKNIIDSVLKLNSNEFGILPTRRQIDYNGGYVQNWNTKQFYEYVRNQSKIVLQRDHGGVNQGTISDDGYDSFRNDANYFDIIHIDPWKHYQKFEDGVWETIKSINYIHTINPNIKFEISTEEAIRMFSIDELFNMLNILHTKLSESAFNNIEYVVIQSGVSLNTLDKRNTGIFNKNRFDEMIGVCNHWNKKSKEHNGDYLSNEQYQWRFDNGLSSINIGPEMVQIETDTYIEHMSDIHIDEFYEICLESKRWQRWIRDGFDVNDKRKLIQICGHYCFNSYKLPEIDNIIKDKITNKLNSLPL